MARLVSSGCDVALQEVRTYLSKGEVNMAGLGQHALAAALGHVHFDGGGDQALSYSIDGGGIAVPFSAPDNIAPHRDRGAPDSDELGDVGVPSDGHDAACGAGRGARLDADGDNVMAGSNASSSVGLGDSPPHRPAKRRRVYRRILPGHALALCMGLHKRLGEGSPLRVLCAEVLRDHILRDFQHLGMTLFFKNYKHTLDVSVQARRSDPATHYPIHPPTVHVVGRILGVETHGMSKQVVLMRDQWENFLHKVIGGLFFKFVILLQSDEDNKADELKDYQAVMWESSNQQPLFGNDVAYIQGLIDCFLSTAKQRTYQRGQGRIVVRRVEGSDVLQTFMFGRKVDRQALLSTSTLRGPLHTITVLQTKGLGVHGGGARKGGQNGSSRLSRCERVHFVDAVRKGVPVKCVLE